MKVWYLITDVGRKTHMHVPPWGTSFGIEANVSRRVSYFLLPPVGVLRTISKHAQGTEAAFVEDVIRSKCAAGAGVDDITTSTAAGNLHPARAIVLLSVDTITAPEACF